MRFLDAGYLSSKSFARIGREIKFPPQLGHRSFSSVATQSLQKVHLKEQIIASSESGGRSLSQHSQFGLSSNIEFYTSVHG